MTDILQEKNEVARCEARLPGTPRAAFFTLTALAVVCALLLGLTGRLPYGAFFQLGVLALAAVCVNFILKRGTFTVTYVLTDDNMLIYITKYGFLSRETAHIDLGRAELGKNKIIFENKSYDFYPDGEFYKLLSGEK